MRYLVKYRKVLFSFFFYPLPIKYMILRKKTSLELEDIIFFVVLQIQSTTREKTSLWYSYKVF